MFYLNKKAMTLNEIMVALVVLATAFIPIIGVLSSSYKVTEKDDHIIKGMQLCQEKLGIAIQFPYEFFTPGNYNTQQVSPNTTNQLKLKLGKEKLGKIEFTSTLTVQQPDITFHNVPVFDYTNKPATVNWSNASSWVNIIPNVSANGMVKKYIVRVTWTEKGNNNQSIDKFYQLSTLKANVRR